MQDIVHRLERNAGRVLPDFCQTMSSLERILKAYEQAGSILPSQYQCRPTMRSGAISVRSMRAAPPRLTAFKAGLRSCPWPRLRPGGARRSRTDDILLAKQALYQLSYGPVPVGTVQSQES